ncbi:MAG: hypothetical protein ACJAZP_004053 [Psychromonas sp.]|jgi:hypothetical protein|uniref:hypothetical protein n=1 Tax=Psychromonas sp. TaxID=1884585 RepID=UPI0039E58F78
MLHKLINTLRNLQSGLADLWLLIILLACSVSTYNLLPFLHRLSYGDWLAMQGIFIQDQFSIDSLLVDAILDACPPVLLMWGVMILCMPAPDDTSSKSRTNWLIKFVSKFLTAPLTTIFIALGGILIGVAATSIFKESETALAFLFGLYGLLLAWLGWGIKRSFSKDQKTQNNTIGRFFHRHKEKISTIYFCFALSIYLWNIFAMPYQLVNYLLSLPIS